MKNTLLFFVLFTSGFAFSQDDIIWNPSQDISIKSYGNLHPRISLDAEGNPMVIWGKKSDQALYFSKWEGTSFTNPVKLNPAGVTIATETWMGPDIASKGDTVYVVMKSTPETSDTNHIYIRSSFDGGASFSAPVQVDYLADSLSRFCTAAIDNDGNPLVAFMKFNSSFADARWVVSKSLDFGKSFLPDIKASGWSGSDAVVCDCCPGALISAGNVSAMLYRDNLNNKRDIWAGISHDNSTSFENGFSVDNGKWNINYCPSTGPDGIIIGDTLYTVYMSGDLGESRTFFSKSNISKASLVKSYGLTGSITGLTDQNYPRIAADGNAVAIVWTQTVLTNDQLPILFTKDITKGLPAKSENIDSGNITNVDVAIKNGNIYVVWEDDGSGTVKFRSGTYDPVITNVTTPKTNDIKIYPNPVSEVLNIETAKNENFEVLIFNSLGYKFIYRLNNSNKLNISDLPNGMYFITVVSGGITITQKFIKQ